MESLDDGSVDLVVTSPPYPMIEMWDSVFGEMNSEVATALEDGDGQQAFDKMHAELDKVWEEVNRVLSPGGVACINIGDATRSIGGEFRLYSNHARIVNAFRDLGFTTLPDILWRKPSNKKTKFMGSGMIPTNAYVSLEHEYILVFRKGGTREFEPGDDSRYESAYFWEERNRWFSDVWTDVNGVEQSSPGSGTRDRTAAFPLSIPYRLINMYSVYGDVVLDPFWGTGTTGLAAMIAGRNSVGFELEDAYESVFAERVQKAPDLSETQVRLRLTRHDEFLDSNPDKGIYEADHYDTEVVTKQESGIRFYRAADVEQVEPGVYQATHEPVDDVSDC